MMRNIILHSFSQGGSLDKNLRFHKFVLHLDFKCFREIHVIDEDHAADFVILICYVSVQETVSIVSCHFKMS